MICVNMLRLNEFHETLATMRAAAARVFETAPRSLTDAMRVEDFVDANGAGLDLPGDALGFCTVAGPDAGCQAKFAVICQLYRFCFGRKRRYRQGRAEGFFPHGPHVIGRSSDDSR